jgi:hypothetical protein
VTMRPSTDAIMGQITRGRREADVTDVAIP